MPTGGEGSDRGAASSLLHRLYDPLPFGVSVKQREPLRVVYANPAYQELFRTDVEALRRDPAAFLTVVHPDDRDAAWRWTLSALHRQGPSRTQYRVARPGGPLRWVRAAAQPLAALSGGERAWCVLVVDDATDLQEARREAAARSDELHEVQDALSRAIDEAREASIARNEILASISHEMRTPLAAVVGYAEMLGDANLPERESQWVDQIRRASAHLGHFLDSVLDIARIELGTAELSITDVSFAEVVSECVGMVEPTARDRSMRIDLRWRDTADSTVRADRERLVQIVLNLLSNALKFGPTGSTVTVNVRRGARSVRVEVTDQGPGIARADQERIFRPFERLDARDRGIGGSGLGLALSRGLAESMNGRITLRSRPGHGATFAVELPLTGRSDSRSAER